MVLILVAFVGSTPVARSAPGEIPPATVATALPPPKETAAVLAEITEWIMGLDLGSGTVKGYDHGTNHLNRSIFINGNLARVLMGSYRVTRNESHLREVCLKVLPRRFSPPFAQQRLPSRSLPIQCPLTARTGDARDHPRLSADDFSVLVRRWRGATCW